MLKKIAAVAGLLAWASACVVGSLICFSAGGLENIIDGFGGIVLAGIILFGAYEARSNSSWGRS